LTLVVASLYLLISAFLFGSAIYILSRNPFLRLNQVYACLALAQLGWVGTLFVFNATPISPALLWVGRANFAAAALTAPSVFAFVQALLKKPIRRMSWIVGETITVAALSLGTGLIDQAETIRGSLHITTYGWLFPLYIFHLLLYLAPALWQALTAPLHLAERQQVRLVGIGMLITTGVGIITNVVLPYSFGNFSLIDIGTLSTISALAAIAYATCVLNLFNIRVVIRAALVIALLIAFALELYQAAVSALAALLPLTDPTQRHIAAATVALIVNAFTQQPLRWWLERLAARLIKRKRTPTGAEKRLQ
jgi:uncharacterized protein YjeT (DUF2065 family)